MWSDVSDIAIRVENLSKRYRIGLKEEIHDTLVGAIADFVKSPVRNLQRLRKLSRFSEYEDADDVIWALKDVSFEIQRGEVVGIIGRNGAGKTTLLKILSRVTVPTRGRAEVRGRVSSLLEVGTGFHPELTGRENVYLNGTILGMRKVEVDRKFDEIVEFSGVEKFIDTPVKRYSKGMKVRLAFSVAAHLEPEILLVDEVLAVGDVQFQRKCLGKMSDVAREGRTVLFVSHNMGAIQRLCRRAIWLDYGKIVADGDAKNIVNRYLDFATGSWGQDARQAPSDFQGMVIERVVLKNSIEEVTASFESGSDIIVEIHYNALRRILRPNFWIAVESQYGSLFGASMLLDGLCPDYIDGKGVISCVFKNVGLLPQTFTINIGARDKSGRRSLVPTIKGAAVIRITGDAHSLGMPGELADMFLESAAPMRVPYEWRFMDGAVTAPGSVKGDHGS